MSRTPVPGLVLGRSELVLCLGRGGMATVWIARLRGQTRAQDRLAAVKIMLPELAKDSGFVRMFYDEVQLVSAIRHPNVVDVYEVGEEAGLMYMTMEWVEGASLHGLLAEAGKRRPIPHEIAVRVIADAAAGLHAAHELRGPDGNLRGVVHRDVSPHNILISKSGRIKLVDFGVAKALGRLSDATQVGQLKGKFGYMAPEQALGRTVDRRTDVFALGTVLYELTTNRRLFRGETDLATLRQVISAEVPRPSSLETQYPVQLEAIVLKALEKDPRNRFQSAAEFEAALRDYLRAERIVVPRSGVAGLLKRVLGERVEERRIEIRQALKALRSEGRAPELLSNEPAFTPTGTRDDTSGGGGQPKTSEHSPAVSAPPATRAPEQAPQGTHARKPSAPTTAGEEQGTAGAAALRRVAISYALMGFGVAAVLGFLIALVAGVWP